MKIASQAVRRILIAAVAVVVLPGVAITRADEAAEVTPETREAEAKPGENPVELERRQQIKQQIKQQAVTWEQQFTKLLHGDLELMRLVCGDLPRESRRAIARDGEQAARDASIRIAELQFQDQRRQPQVGFPWQGVAGAVLKAIVPPVAGPIAASGGGKPADDPVSFFSAALTKSLEEHVGREQAGEFSRQLAARNERRKAATICAIVAALDAELGLSAEQREKIERSLLERWNDSMVMAVHGMHTNNGGRIFPGLPDECVRPHLTEAQRQRFPRQVILNDGAWQRQSWMQTLNMLNAVHNAQPDPWWTE